MACEQIKKYGPYGEKHAPLSYEVQWNPKRERLNQIKIRSGFIVDAIGFGTIDTFGQETPPVMHGGSGGNPHKITLQLGETVTGIRGKSRNSQISQLKIYTNHCESGYGPYGTNSDGRDFKSDELEEDESIVGFFGSAINDSVASIGFLAEKDE